MDSMDSLVKATLEILSFTILSFFSNFFGEFVTYAKYLHMPFLNSSSLYRAP